MAVRDEKYFRKGRLITARIPLEVAEKYEQLRALLGTNPRFAIGGKPSKTHQMVLSALILYMARVVDFQGERGKKWLEDELGPHYDQLNILALQYLAAEGTKKAAGGKAAPSTPKKSTHKGPQGIVTRPGAEDETGLSIDPEHPAEADRPPVKPRRRSSDR
jgi:hypothetical protein